MSVILQWSLKFDYRETTQNIGKKFSLKKISNLDGKVHTHELLQIQVAFTRLFLFFCFFRVIVSLPEKLLGTPQNELLLLLLLISYHWYNLKMDSICFFKIDCFDRFSTS